MSNPTDRYFELVAKRDEINAQVAPLQRELDAAIVEAQAAQQKAAELATRISDLRGGQAWLDLKSELAGLVRLLGKVPAHPASPSIIGFEPSGPTKPSLWARIKALFR